MPNQITRDIYVTKDVLKNPIHYVRGTDLIPIVMRFCDFTIPSGATARIFVGKPDGNAVYTSATIEGNTVTIDVTEQMFVTLGLALMQVSIVDGDEELVTFAQPVMVEPNLKAGDFPESSTDITFLDDAIEQANEAVETATTAAQKAATAVQNANTAISEANSAIADVNEAVSSMNANFANLAQVATINALQTTAKTVVGAINELNSNKPRCIRNNWGTSITIPGIHEGGTNNPYGFVINNQRDLYIVWVSGTKGSLEANTHRIWKLTEENDILQFSVDPNTGTLTITASKTTAIMYIGA